MYQNIFYDKYSNSIHVWDDKEGYKCEKYRRCYYVPDPDGEFVSLYGLPLRQEYGSVGETTDVFQSDIKPEMDYILQNYLNEDDPSSGHVICYFDIEVERTDKFSKPEDADNKITSVTLYDNISKKYVTLLLDDSNTEFNIDKENFELICYSTEVELLYGLLEYWENLSPHIITGWNIDYFDIPYMVNRMKKVLGDGSTRRLSPISIIKDTHDGRFEIAGITSLDYLYLYKKFSLNESAFYTLDYISKTEISRGKIEFDGSLQNLYETDVEKFVEYNVVDVDLVVELDQKLKFIDLVLAICHECHVPYNAIWHTSYYLDGAAMTYLNRLNIIAPNKKFHGSGENAIGAYVQEPKVGYHKWIYDLDLTSLYPSIIRTLNISPETKLGRIMNWDEEEYQKPDDITYQLTVYNREPETISKKQLKGLFDKGACIASNGVLYRTDKRGFLPEILGFWIEQRGVLKNEMKTHRRNGDTEKEEYFKLRQLVKKILANSFYGVLLLDSFRFYDMDNGEAITTTGQSIIKFSKKVANNYYNKILGDNEDHCIYIDTDSVFFPADPIYYKLKGQHLDDIDQELAPKEVVDIASKIQTYINKMYDIYAEKLHMTKTHFLEIKQEVVARRGFWIAKKRYAQKLIFEEGVPVDKLEVKGLDVVRSDFPKSFRSAMESLLIYILEDNDKSMVTQKIIDLKKEVKKNIIQDNMTPTGVKDVTKWDENRAKFQFVKGTPIHVKSALAYNDFIDYKQLKGYRKIADGDKIMWAYLVDNPLNIKTMALTNDDDPKEIIQFIEKYIDLDKIFDGLVKKIQDFYDSLGWGQIILNTNVTTFLEI